MGQVYRVRHTRTGGAYALKILPLASSLQRARLLREGQMQSRLRHRNVVRLFEQFEHETDPVLVMELVEGPGLDRWLTDHRPSPEEAEELFVQIVRGVAHAHDRGVVHRDLKPSNVLLAKTKDGWVPKVADFGIAHNDADDEDSLTIEGEGLGSPAYMAPEQAHSAVDVDQRADLFSLGCLLYELLAGERAFKGDNPLRVLQAAAQGDYRDSREVAPGAPETLHLAVDRCLVASREARIGSCRELLALMGKDQDAAGADQEDTDIRAADQEDTDVRAGGGDATVLYGDRAGAHAATVLYGQSSDSELPPEPTRLFASRTVWLALGLVILALAVSVAVLSSQQGDTGDEGDYVPLEDVLGGH